MAPFHILNYSLGTGIVTSGAVSPPGTMLGAGLDELEVNSLKSKLRSVPPSIPLTVPVKEYCHMLCA